MRGGKFFGLLSTCITEGLSRQDIHRAYLSARQRAARASRALSKRTQLFRCPIILLYFKRIYSLNKRISQKYPQIFSPCASSHMEDGKKGACPGLRAASACRRESYELDKDCQRIKLRHQKKARVAIRDVASLPEVLTAHGGAHRPTTLSGRSWNQTNSTREGSDAKREGLLGSALEDVSSKSN